MITFDTFYTIQRVSGLSQDDKPLGMKPGSIFMELDTGKKFIFDGENWHEQPGGGGGGGGKQLLAAVTTEDLTSEVELAWQDPKREITIIMMETTFNKSYMEDASGQIVGERLLAHINDLTDKTLWLANSITTYGDHVCSKADLMVSDNLVMVGYNQPSESSNGYSGTGYINAPRFYSEPIEGINKIKFFPGNNNYLFSVGMRFEVWG